MKLDPNRAAPLYSQIYLVIRNAITEGNLPHKSRLPGEAQLAKFYGVSRITVKRALNDLAADNYVIRRQGRGTFVHYNPKSDVLVTHYEADVTKWLLLGAESDVKVLSVGSIKANPEIAANLGIDEGDEVMEVVRLRIKNKKPSSMVKCYLSKNLESVFSYERANSRRFFMSLVQESGFRISQIQHIFSSVLSDPYTSGPLDVELGTALTKLTSLLLDQNGDPIHYECLYALPECYRYEFNMSGNDNIFNL